MYRSKQQFVSVLYIHTLEYQCHYSCLCCIYFAYQTNVKPYVNPVCNPEAKFIFPDWEDIVDSVIGLSYRPVRLYRLSGRYDNPMPESTISPSPGL